MATPANKRPKEFISTEGAELLDTPPTTSPALMTSAEVARYLRVSEATLSRWRSGNRGPVWVNLHGIARYRNADVVGFVQDVSHDNI